MIRTRPKRIGSVQNDWYSTKMIWTVQNRFGPIEGKGITMKIIDIVKDIPGKSYDLEERQVLDEGCCGNCKNNQGVP